MMPAFPRSSRTKEHPANKGLIFVGRQIHIEEQYMKRYMMLLTAFAVFSTVAWAEEGGALYKTKCAACHGAAGEGKLGPSLQKTTMSEKQVADVLTNGAAGKK